MSDSHAALEQALAMTMDMLKAAERGKWSLVTALDADRQEVLAPVYGTADPRNADVLAELVECNNTLLDLAIRAREALAGELGTHKYNHRALNAYCKSSH